MSFVSGLYQICADPDCDSVNLDIVRESWDDKAGIFVGEQACGQCGCRMLFSRKPSTPLEIQMAKKAKGGKPRAKKNTNGSGEPVSHRVNTISGNGDAPTSTEIAPAEPTTAEIMRRAVEALGDVTIDDQLAPSQMRQAGEMIEQIERAKAAYLAKAEAAKTAKKTLESAQEMLQTFVKECTHPTPLPLFDGAQAETDLTGMLNGGEVDDSDDPDALADEARA